LDGCDWLQPARRGDVEAASRRYDAVLLIDGVFHHQLAVSPKETYEALHRCRMYGASSMGALRGVECKPYGMRCLGVIARWYEAGVLDGDDEVAVLVDPTTQRPLTVPSVNVRFLAWRAARAGILSPQEASELVCRARDIFYQDRDWASVIRLAPEIVRERLRPFTVSSDLKRIDAVTAMRTVQRINVR
jgi:hypothetical protein